LQSILERSLSDLHLFGYLGTPFIIVISTNGSGETDADKYLTKIGRLFGMVKLGMCFVSRNDAFDDKRFERIVAKGRSALEEGRVRPSMMKSLYFDSMKKIIKRNPSFFEHEHKVWEQRGWFDYHKDRDLR
jgi:hypothetical protein